MNNLRQATQMALEVFESINHEDAVFKGEFDSEVEALRQALEEPADSTKDVVDTETPIHTPQALPVGYADKFDLEREGHDFWVSRQEGKHTVPLYAKQYQQETVGWATITNGYPSMWVFNPEYVKNNPNTTVTLYTTPPKREWAGLTDNEIQSLADNYLDVGDGEGGKHYVFGGVDFARAIEAKLKEKNND